MSKKNGRRPARPHWERVVSRRANNKNETWTPEYFYGFYKSYKRQVRPSNAKPE